MNTLYLIRHGENPANITKEFSHRLVDYSLTPKGVLQAQQTGEYFKNKQIDAIYCSPLKRARTRSTMQAQPVCLRPSSLTQTMPNSVSRSSSSALKLRSRMR